MAKISEIPSSQRPREKVIRYGVESLSDYELLALLINSGCKDYSALDIAHQMINSNGGLVSLIQKPFLDLVKYKGMGKIKAVKLVACFELAKRFQNLKTTEIKTENDIDDIYKKYRLLIANEFDQEHVFLIILNRKKEIIHEVNLYKGTEESVECSSLEIVREVLIHNGKYFYIIHNHPSGLINPSVEDIAFTKELMITSEKMKLTMLDHLIVSMNGYYSFIKDEAKNY